MSLGGVKGWKKKKKKTGRHANVGGGKGEANLANAGPAGGQGGVEMRGKIARATRGSTKTKQPR